MAVYLVLMPIFEADFHPRSFGFRPGRNAHQAVEAIREALRMGKTLARPPASLFPSAASVVDADVAQYFDTIPHGKLMRQVARRVSDGAILKLHQKHGCAPSCWRKKRVVAKEWWPNPCRTPQGGVICQLMSEDES